jgi:TonB-dependent starch-binding outer membrane protein SusC
MKKIYNLHRTFIFKICSKKTLRIMKLSVLIILVTVVNAFGGVTYSQNARLNLEMKHVPIKDVISSIEGQSEFFFLYSSKMIDVTQEVNIHEVDQTITAVLDDLFAKTNIKYDIKDRQILLIDKGTESATGQQERKISGKVTNQAGEPLIGVTVLVSGTTQGSLTDINGNYSISVPGNATKLAFTFIGMTKVEFEIGNKTVMDVLMKEEAIGLDEVVVIGYGVQKKVSLTGAVSSIGSADLSRQAGGDAISRIQGQIAGVTVTTDNTPGAVATIRVRGYGSLGNNNPLFVIDGVPRNSMDNINTNEIESMTVLKDASSSAIYGSRAANGVVLITTKRGVEGKTKVDFTAHYGFQYLTKGSKPKLLNAQQYGDVLWQRWTNQGLKPGDVGWGNAQYGYGATPVVPDYIFPAGKMDGQVDESTYTPPSVLPFNAITKANKGDNLYNEQWWEGAPTRDINLNLSGGNNGSTYSISLGYSDVLSLYNFRGDQYNDATSNGFKRYTLRYNADLKVTKWLKISPTLSANYQNRLGSQNNGSGILGFHPLIPIYDIAGNFAGTKIPVTGNGVNQIADMVRAKNNYRNNLIVQTSTTAQITFSKELLFKSLLGASYRPTYGETYTLANPEFNQTNNTALMAAAYSDEFQVNWVNTLNYMKTINNNHNFNVLLGVETLSNKSTSEGAGRSTYAFQSLDYMVLSSGEKDITNTGTRTGNKLFSYFGRLNYDYKGKYLFEGTLRRDGSSRFTGVNRWGTFPAFSVGWRISQESFMSDIKSINDLKIRGGWGENGNDNVGNFNSYSTFSSNDIYSYYNITGASRSSISAGLSPTRYGNSTAKWETGISTNLGLDLVMFDHRLSASLDVYKRSTSDMLYNDSKPSTWGIVTLPQINIGEMKNSGFDFVLSYNGGRKDADFTYKVSGTLSHFKNEVMRLNSNPNEIRYGTSTEAGNSTATQAGQPLESYYGYVFEGYFNTQAEIDAWPKYNPNAAGVDTYTQLGVMKFKDVNGDGIITPADRTWLGDGFPKLTYGFNVSLKYKNFDLSSFLSGVWGRKILENWERTLIFVRNDSQYLLKRLNESWTQDRYNAGAKITVPITIPTDANMQLPNSWFICNGDYARLKDFQIGYTLPRSVLSKLKMDTFRVSFQISNLFTITKYEGMNPEVNDLGVDSNVYPTPRVFTFGINMVL